MRVLFPVRHFHREKDSRHFGVRFVSPPLITRHFRLPIQFPCPPQFVTVQRRKYFSKQLLYNFPLVRHF